MAQFITLALLLTFAFGDLLYVIEFATEGAHTAGITLDAGHMPNKLLPEGKDVHNKLGAQIRTEYPTLFDEEDDIKLFHFHTDDTEYAKESLQAQLDGLLQGVQGPSIEVVPSADVNCPRIQWLIEEDHVNRKEHKELIGQLEPHEQALARVVGKPAGTKLTYADYFTIGEAVRIQKKLKLEMPAEIQPDLVDPLLNFHEHYQEFLSTGNKEQIKLLAHQGLTTILNDIKSAISKEKRAKRSKLCVHLVDEVTMISILKMMNMYTSHPVIPSHLIVELHKRYDSFFVKVRYNWSYLPVPSCGVECPWKKFFNIISKRIFSSDEEFHETCFSEVSNKKSYWFRYFFSLFAFFVLFIGGLWIWNRWYGPKPKTE